MTIYKIKRGLSTSLQGATFNVYEPAYTTDTNELFVADENGKAIKVTDHIVVTELPAPEDAIKGKFYVVTPTDKDNGVVYLFEGAKFVALSPDLSLVSGALSAVQATLIAIQTELDAKATKEELETVKELAQKANDDLAAHDSDAESKYATKEEIQDVATKTYVDGKLTDLVGGAPEALDTLIEISERLEADKTAADAIQTLAEANRDAIAKKAEQADLSGAVDRIVALENKPSVAGTNVVVGEETMAGDITFQATGEATISVDARTKVVTINVPEITELDGGTF